MPKSANGVPELLLITIAPSAVLPSDVAVLSANIVNSPLALYAVIPVILAVLMSDTKLATVVPVNVTVEPLIIMASELVSVGLEVVAITVPCEFCQLVLPTSTQLLSYFL